jgi:hypothetical protein
MKKIKGVEKTRQGKFMARITVNKQRLNLGTFSTEIQAAKVYNEAAKKHFGEFASLNEFNEPLSDKEI